MTTTKQKSTIDNYVFWYDQQDLTDQYGDIIQRRRTNCLFIDEDGVLNYVNAICSDLDTFCKKKGRSLASVRMQNLHNFNMDIPRGFTTVRMPIPTLIDQYLLEETEEQQQDLVAEYLLANDYENELDDETVDMISRLFNIALKKSTKNWINNATTEQ